MKGHFLDDNGAILTDAAPQAAGGKIPLEYKTKEPFAADRKDSIFALFVFVLGFLFARWVMFSWQGWGVTVFTIVYCFTTTTYLMKKGVHMTRPGFFWLAAIVLVGISYSLYENNGLEPWRSLFLFCAAPYYVICATGQLILCNTGNWFLLDGINGLFVIPFKNIGCQYKSLSLPKYTKRGLGKQILSVALGLLLTLLVAGMVLPLLMRADSGGFSKIAKVLYEYYRLVQRQFADIIFSGILAIPIAAYLFGLVAGCAHNRGCGTFKREGIQYAVESVRVLTSTTVYTVLGLICCLYLVFIGSQLPYFFSAFVGQRPEGWQIYSEYARSGFFELCQIAAINLSLLILANLLCKKPQRENYALKILNCLLSLLTLLLIATAFSKCLYIGDTGFHPQAAAVLVQFFMLLFAAV